MAQPAAAAPADIQAALNNHDRVRRATDIPLFFGNKAKDTISARLLLARINRAAQIANWDQARKLDNFYMILRETAVTWWEDLEEEGVNVANWDTVSAEFLAAYEPKYTAKTTCTNFQELIQRQGEGAHDYYLRVCDAFKRMCEAKADDMYTVRLAADAAAADVKKEGIQDSERFFKHQLFLAGLKDDLRHKVMEAGKERLRESMRLAVELEVIHHDRKRGAIAAVDSRGSVSAIKEEEEDEGLFDEEEVAAINAIRFRNGKPPFKSGFRKPGNRSSVICRFCKKPGHMQKDCRARKRVNGPMVDAQGKPFERRNGVSAVEASAAAAAASEGENKTVGSIVSSALNALNW